MQTTKAQDVCVEETALLRPKKIAQAETMVTCRDHAKQKQWRNLNIFENGWIILCILSRRRGDYGKVHNVNSALGGSQQALHPGVRGLRSDPDA